MPLADGAEILGQTFLLLGGCLGYVTEFAIFDRILGAGVLEVDLHELREALE